MSATGLGRPRGRFVALIGAVTLIPLTTLLWLGWRLVVQDRTLETQQVRQRVERSADLLVSAIQRAIAVSAERLASGDGSWPEGVVQVEVREGRVDVSPAGRVAYLPVVPPLKEPPLSSFVQADDLELRQHDLAGATALFHELAQSSDPSIQAGALLRLGRALRRSGHIQEALDAYAHLSAIEHVSLDGVPTGLVGMYARGTLFEEQKRSADVRSLGTELERDLHSGRWALAGSVYELYAADATRWSGSPSLEQHHTEQELFAEAVETLWARWRDTRPSPSATAGVESLALRGGAVTVLTRPSEGAIRALLASSSYVESAWLNSTATITGQEGVTFALLGADGTRTYGQAGAANSYSTARTAADSGLPWKILVTTLDPPIEAREFALRRRLLVAGLALLVALALAASYVIVRGMSRELAVVRLQSDFVAAVSHEFRTPLTSLRQFTDILREQPDMETDQRVVAYEALSRATDRLTRLVDSLLDFGRMEAGVRRYEFQPQNCDAAIGRIVDDFRSEARASGHEVEFRSTGPVAVVVDDEAIGRAVRNLLDNAVKYSPDSSPIEVGLERRNGQVRVSVRDRGIGIPPEEQSSIFAKFQRGEEARTRGIKGTGIGLAMVDEIVKAHHGRIELESTQGQGSTFTIVLPASQD